MDEYVNKILYPDSVRKGGTEIEVDSEERGILDLLRLHPENRLLVETVVGDPEAQNDKRAAAKEVRSLVRLRELKLIEESDGLLSLAQDVEVPWPFPEGRPSFKELREHFREKGERAREYLKARGMDSDKPSDHLRKHLRGSGKRK